MWHHNLGNKQSCSIGNKVLPSISRSKRQSDNEVWSVNRLWQTFFLKYHTQNVLEKLFPEAFIKNKNWAYFWISSLKFYTVCFCCMSTWGLSKCFEIKQRTTCFYLILGFFKKLKRSSFSLPAFFSLWLFKKNISLAMFY